MVAAAAPAAGVGACLDALARNGEGEPLPPRFTLLSWNIHKLFDPRALADLERLAGELILLQEARPAAGLPERLRDQRHMAFNPAFQLAGEATGVATLSPGPPSVHCRLLSREPWLGTPKGIAVTRHPLPGGAPLLVVNIHGVNVSVGTRVFSEQLAALDPLLAAHGGPVILGGDVNAWSRPRQRVLDALARRHSLRPITFEPDHRTRILPLPMDYLYQRGLRVLSAEALPVTSSDHNPLRVELALPRDG
jgi:endonuclease/exonuclease/phosphatase (EEP) superfamily protein YafD